MMSQEDKNILYQNPPQTRAYLMDAPEEIHICGRGTGKSSGILADKTIKWVHAMPRCVIANLAASYQQHLERTLPALKEGWLKRGFIEGVHYFVGKLAPKHMNWPVPRRVPLKHTHTIHWYTGAIIQMLSQEVKGSANGMNIDAVVGDEVKYWKREPYENELLPAMRGNEQYYKATKQNGWMSYHHNICLTTDMPTNPDGMWLLDKESEMDIERAKLVMDQSYKAEQLKLKIYQNAQNGSNTASLRSKLLKIQQTLFFLRKGNPNANVDHLTYYQEASSWENIHVLKFSYFTRHLKTMNYFDFSSSILNEKNNKASHTFYPDLRDRIHGYSRYNQSYIENQEYRDDYVADCRQDADIDPNQPLCFAGDYGGSFNGLVVSQPNARTIYWNKNFHVLYPKKIKHLIIDVKEYYRYHGYKKFIIYYDHTHIGTSAVSENNMIQEIVDLLTRDIQGEGAWEVELKYIGSTPSYDARYLMWGKILQGTHKSGFDFKFNRNNCAEWETSCNLAPMKIGPKGTEKDKSSEKKRPGKREYPVSQEKATHYSDAGDVLMHGILTDPPVMLSTGFSFTD